jgi:hypothetical protein
MSNGAAGHVRQKACKVLRQILQSDMKAAASPFRRRLKARDQAQPRTASEARAKLAELGIGEEDVTAPLKPGQR